MAFLWLYKWGVIREPLTSLLRPSWDDHPPGIHHFARGLERLMAEIFLSTSDKRSPIDKNQIKQTV